jgi:hypothetical protein
MSCSDWIDGRLRILNGRADQMSSAGRPGLLKPLSVHHDHRGHVYSRAITVCGRGRPSRTRRVECDRLIRPDSLTMKALRRGRHSDVAEHSELR